VTSVALWLAETESEAHYSWTDVHALKKRGLDLTDRKSERCSDLCLVTSKKNKLEALLLLKKKTHCGGELIHLQEVAPSSSWGTD
jgi:hypothetical protein